MFKLTSVVLSLILAFGSLGSGLMAKAGKGQGKGAEAAGGKSNIRSNGQGTADRDFATERAEEVGKGEKKGLSKQHDSHSTSHHAKKKKHHGENHKQNDRDTGRQKDH